MGTHKTVELVVDRHDPSFPLPIGCSDASLNVDVERTVVDDELVVVLINNNVSTTL